MKTFVVDKHLPRGSYLESIPQIHTTVVDAETYSEAVEKSQVGFLDCEKVEIFQVNIEIRNEEKE